jgi:hypothetical protein
MTNYIIEGGIDFYAEINNAISDKQSSDKQSSDKQSSDKQSSDNQSSDNQSSDNQSSDNQSSDDSKCLITKEPLIHNFITLPCGHKFNYLPLYKEILLQKINVSTFETVILLPHEIKCPYCRSKFDRLLPYINYEHVERLKGVNYPDSRCMKHRVCLWSMCEKNAYEHIDENISGAYCEVHWKQVLKTIKEQQFEMTEEMKQFAKNTSVIEMKKILREMKLIVSGNKKQLVIRIFENKCFIK